MTKYFEKWPPGRILVVDDDEAICAYIELMFAGTQLVAQSVHSDRHAYAALAQPQDIRGLILDLNLGQGTTGFDIARFARRIDPNIPVIYITGEAPHGSVELFGVSNAGYLRKPFSREELLEMLESLFVVSL